MRLSEVPQFSRDPRASWQKSAGQNLQFSLLSLMHFPSHDTIPQTLLAPDCRFCSIFLMGNFPWSVTYQHFLPKGKKLRGIRILFCFCYSWVKPSRRNFCLGSELPFLSRERDNPPCWRYRQQQREKKRGWGWKKGGGEGNRKRNNHTMINNKPYPSSSWW